MVYVSNGQFVCECGRQQVASHPPEVCFIAIQRKNKADLDGKYSTLKHSMENKSHLFPLNLDGITTTMYRH